jgi:L-fuconolactonase
MPFTDSGPGQALAATLRIDAHQHFWQPARADYGWLRADVPALAPLLRDFWPADLQPLLARHRIAQTVLVQAAPSEAETDFLLGLAAEHSFIGGVVGWVDLGRADAVSTLQRWARQPKFKGVRPMLQDLAQADWIATAPHPDVLRALVSLGLRFDALVQPRHLAPLLQFVQAWPALPVVIDHAAKPQLATGWAADWADEWRQGLAALAQHPQVMCKLSGLLTEATPADCRDVASAAAALQPVWQHLLDRFGPARLIWGSDWPVLTLAADYAAWVAVSEALIGALPPSDQASVWAGNASRFYGLDSAWT